MEFMVSCERTPATVCVDADKGVITISSNPSAAYSYEHMLKCDLNTSSEHYGTKTLVLTFLNVEAMDVASKFKANRLEMQERRGNESDLDELYKTISSSWNVLERSVLTLCGDVSTKTVEILVNPVSGDGSGEVFARNAILPLLKHLGVEVTLYVSSKIGEIESHCSQMNASVGVLVTVGGDGTLHECINGFLKSSDRTILPAVCTIPCGSGNAVANSLSTSGMKKSASVLSLVRGSTVTTSPMSVFIPVDDVEQNDLLVYSCCVISSGFHAKLVDQSNKLRWLGRRRFVFVALKQILFPPDTDTHVTLYDAIDSSDVLTANLSKMDTSYGKTVTRSGQLQYFLASKVANLEPGFTITPNANPSIKGMDVILIDKTSANSPSLATILKAVGQGEHGADHIEKYGNEVQCLRTQSFDIRLTKANDILCVDGEIFHIPPPLQPLTMTTVNEGVESQTSINAKYGRPIRVRQSDIQIEMFCN
eukprot:CFRG5723T1